MIVGIDSMVVIYACLAPRKSSKPNSKLAELTNRSKLLLHMLRGDTVVLPTVAISEILAPVSPESRGLLIKKLETLFLCPSFDLAAASIAAQLWAEHKGLAQKDPYSGKRQVLRADAMIIASAKAAGATEFYTNDRKCRNLANRIMTGRDLPTHDPTDMFAADDIANGDL